MEGAVPGFFWNVFGAHSVYTKYIYRASETSQLDCFDCSFLRNCQVNQSPSQLQINVKSSILRCRPAQL